MKSLFMLSIPVLCATVSFVQPAAAGQSTVSQNPGAALVMTGSSFRQEGAVTHARGSVVVKVDAIELRADEVDFNSASGELEARGHVIVVAAGSGAAPSQPLPVGLDKADLQLKLDAARTKLARSEDLFSKGLVSRSEVERAQQELEQLKAQMPTPASAPAAARPAGSGWSIQTDSLKLQVPPASR